MVKPHTKVRYCGFFLNNDNDSIMNSNHSEGITLPGFFQMLEFAKTTERKLLVFNGKTFHTLLRLNGYLDKAEIKEITDKFTMYLFTLDGIPCVLFEQFFPSHWWHLKDEQRSVTIPNLIRQRFEGLINEFNRTNYGV
jgi:hypothetical protein